MTESPQVTFFRQCLYEPVFGTQAWPFRLTVGIHGPVEGESGMTVNLVHVDRWLNEATAAVTEGANRGALLRVLWNFLVARVAPPARLVQVELGWQGHRDGWRCEAGNSVRRHCRREFPVSVTDDLQVGRPRHRWCDWSQPVESLEGWEPDLRAFATAPQLSDGRVVLPIPPPEVRFEAVGERNAAGLSLSISV